MAIYAIGDLHLSFGTNKPMDIFGGNWGNHHLKIKDDWQSKVTENDTVLLLGDFSWAMYLEDTVEDFKFLCSLPGKKIMIKGNHDYWWSTVNKMKNFLDKNGFKNIEFLQNNSFLSENKIICGTRGWTTINNSENYKILKRENIRLNLSLQDAINKYGEDKEIIVCMHYPPFYKNQNITKEIDFIKTMHNYNVVKCLYGHLHSESHKEAVEGLINGIEYKLLSCDYADFKLNKVN